MPADAATRRLLASDPFSRCRRTADVTVASAEDLHTLLAEVELKLIESEFLRSTAMSVHIDIAAAVVEAFLEGEESLEALDPAREARLRLVVSGLHYLVMEQDLVPDGGPHGYADDLAVMRWVTRVVAGSEGHPVDELNGY